MTVRGEMRRSLILIHDLSGEIAVASVNPMKNIRSDCFWLATVNGNDRPLVSDVVVEADNTLLMISAAVPIVGCSEENKSAFSMSMIKPP